MSDPPLSCNPADPDLVYHYTDLSGLEGIVHDRVIWSSDPRDLNDSSELAFALQWSLQWVELKMSDLGSRGAVEGKEPYKEDYSALDCEYNAAGETLGNLRGQVNASTPYVVCFSEQGDNLTMWRAYARDGQGFALGFTRKGFLDQGYAVARCHYPRGPTLPFLEQAWSRCFTFRPGYEGEISTSFVAEVYGEILALKNPHFEDEHEVRLFDYRNNRPTFRKRSGRLRPTGEVSFGPSDLRTIWVGPGVLADRALDRSLEVLKEFLRSHGFGHTTLCRSTAPYRGLTQFG